MYSRTVVVPTAIQTVYAIISINGGLRDHCLLSRRAEVPRSHPRFLLRDNVDGSIHVQHSTKCKLRLCMFVDMNIYRVSL